MTVTTRPKRTTRARSSGVRQGAFPTSSVSTQSGVVDTLPKALSMDNSSTVKKSRKTLYLGWVRDHNLAQRKICRLRSSVLVVMSEVHQALSHIVCSYLLWYPAIFNQLGLGLHGQVRPLLQCLTMLLNGTVQIGHHLYLLALWYGSSATLILRCPWFSAGKSARSSSEYISTWPPFTRSLVLYTSLSQLFPLPFHYLLSCTICGPWLFSIISTIINYIGTAFGSWLSSTVSSLIGFAGASIQHFSLVTTYSALCYFIHNRLIFNLSSCFRHHYRCGGKLV